MTSMLLTPGITTLKDRYFINELIGRGAFGEVYKAQDLTTEKMRAVKVCNPSGTGTTLHTISQEALFRFHEERRLGVKIENENVIRIYDSGTQEGIEYFVMELATDGSLRKVIAGSEEQGLPEKRIISIARDICKGVAALQQEGWVHRDIKPENVLFCENNVAKISDLGTVQTMESVADRSGGEERSQPGTPPYMSPEQRTTKFELTAASDVYSIGCVIFEMLTLHKYRESPALLASLEHERPDVNPVLIQITRKALSEEIAARYLNAQVMLNELDTLIGQGKAGDKPFIFSIGAVRTPEVWARTADKIWEEALRAVRETVPGQPFALGRLELWLLERNDRALATGVARIREENKDDQDMALEKIIHFLDPNTEKPRFSVSGEMIDFKQARFGDRPSQTIAISNTGRGYIRGAINSNIPWLRLRSNVIKIKPGKFASIIIELDTKASGEGNLDSKNAVVSITSNAGEHTVPVFGDVVWEPEMEISANSLNFGEIQVYEDMPVSSRSVTFTNLGGGNLQVSLSPTETGLGQWVSISPTEFGLTSNEEREVSITIEPARLGEVGETKFGVQITSNDPRSPSRLLSGIARLVPSDIRGAERNELWVVFAGLFALSLIAWGGFAAFLAGWLFGGLQPEPWHFIPAVLIPLAVNIVFGTVMKQRDIREKLNKMEDFFHYGSLAEEIPARNTNVLIKSLFAAIMAALAVVPTLVPIPTTVNFDVNRILLPARQLGVALPNIELLKVPSVAVAGLAAFLLGLFVIGNRPAKGALTNGQKRLSGLGAIVCSILVILLSIVYSVPATRPTPFTAQTWADYIPLALLGMLFVADLFDVLPMRLRWWLSRIRNAYPALMLLWLAEKAFVALQIRRVLLGYTYIFYTRWGNSFITWNFANTGPEWLLVGALIIIAILGIVFAHSQNNEFRKSIKGMLTSFIISVVAGILAFLAFSVLIQPVMRFTPSSSDLGLLVGPFWVFMMGCAALFVARSQQGLVSRVRALFSRGAASVNKVAQESISRTKDAIGNSKMGVNTYEAERALEQAKRKARRLSEKTNLSGWFSWQEFSLSEALVGLCLTVLLVPSIDFILRELLSMGLIALLIVVVIVVIVFVGRLMLKNSRN